MPAKGSNKKDSPKAKITDEIKAEMFNYYFAKSWSAIDCSKWLLEKHDIDIASRSIQSMFEAEKLYRNEVAREVLKDRIEVNTGKELEHLTADLAYWRAEGVKKHQKLTEEEKTHAWPSIWKAVAQHNKLLEIFFKASIGLSTPKEVNVDDFVQSVKEKLLKDDK